MDRRPRRRGRGRAVHRVWGTARRGRVARRRPVGVDLRSEGTAEPRPPPITCGLPEMGELPGESLLQFLAVEMIHWALSQHTDVQRLVAVRIRHFPALPTDVVGRADALL